MLGLLPASTLANNMAKKKTGALPKTKPTAIEIARNAFSYRAGVLNRLETAVRDAKFAFDNELRFLERLLDDYPELLDDQAKSSVKYALEDVARSRDLMSLVLDGDDVPFFSEAKLYSLLGKDAARSVLATVDALIRHSV